MTRAEPSKPKRSAAEREFRGALLSVLLDPALQLAADWNVSLPEMVEVVEEAYFRKQNRALNVKRTGQRMGISLRHVFRLKARAAANSLATELELAEQERQTLQALLDGDKSEKQLRARLAHVDLDTCLATLEKMGFVSTDAQGKNARYRLVKRLVRLVNPSGLRFLDGIRFALAPIIHTVRLRTLKHGVGVRPMGSAPPIALARVFSFFTKRASLAKHSDLLLADLLALATRLETEADTSLVSREVDAVSRAHLCVWLSEDSAAK